MRYILFVLFLQSSVLVAGSVQWDRRGIHQYCQDAKKRLGWELVGEGYFRAKPAVSPSIQFDASQCLDVGEARRIIVSECQYLLQLANRTQPIRVTRVTGPFLIENIALGVSFMDPDTRLEYEPPYVASIFVSRGRIFYHSYDNTTKRDGILHKEPYEEALRIVQAEQTACCADTTWP